MNFELRERWDGRDLCQIYLACRILKVGQRNGLERGKVQRTAYEGGVGGGDWNMALLSS